MEGTSPQPAGRKPLEAGGPVTQDWRRINEQDEDVKLLFAQLAQLRRDTAATLPQRHSFGHFPFRIYQLPYYLRAEPDPAADWLKVRVRGGRVLGFEATGTDGALDPDDETFPDIPNAGDFEILIPADIPKFWIWLEISASTAVVKYGDPDSVLGNNPGGAPEDQGWTGWPAPDATHQPIGWVDTQTQLTKQIAIPRQILRTDIVASAGGGLRFASPILYLNTSSYAFEEVVYVCPEDTMVTAGTKDPDSGETVYAIAGTWVALQAVAPVPDPDNEGQFLYHIPQLPYPVPGDPDNPLNFWWMPGPDAQCY